MSMMKEYALKTLNQIQDQNTSIAILERDISHLEIEVKEYIQHKKPTLDIFGKINDITEMVNQLFCSYSETYTNLPKDIIENVELFLNVSNASECKLKFMQVENDMCRRFHTDINELRMICTYFGPGTEWLNQDNVNFYALRNPKENLEIAIDPLKINRVKTGDVCIMKGELYQHDIVSACIHKSPTIENNQQKRLILRIDKNKNHW